MPIQLWLKCSYYTIAIRHWSLTWFLKLYSHILSGVKVVLKVRHCFRMNNERMRFNTLKKIKLEWKFEC